MMTLKKNVSPPQISTHQDRTCKIVELQGLYFFYLYSISTSITNFIEVKKFRTKKLAKNNVLVTKIEKDLNYNLWLISYCYVNFLK